MGKYLLVETRDPFDSADTRNSYELAGALADDGSEVTVYLIQNGVLPAREASAASSQVSDLAAKTTLLADDFSLRERGIETSELVDGVTPTDLDTFVDLVAAGDRKVLWH